MRAESVLPPSLRTALKSLPYALPAALGLVCLCWGLTQLIAAFTSWWVLMELLPGITAVVVGTGLLFLSCIGAVAIAVENG